MPLNTLGLVAGIAVAQNKGVQADQVTRVALPAAIMPNTALGVAVADVLATQEAAIEQQTITAGPPTAGPVGVVTQAVPSAPAPRTQTPTAASGNAATTQAQGAAAVTQAQGAAPTSDPLPQPWSLPGVTLAPKPPPAYKPGDVLEVNPGIWEGAGTNAQPRFQWYRDGNEIHQGGNSSEYTVKVADEGHKLTVEVMYGDDSTGFVSTTSSPIEIPKGHKRRAGQGVEVFETG